MPLGAQLAPMRLDVAVEMRQRDLEPARRRDLDDIVFEADLLRVCRPFAPGVELVGRL